MTGFGDWDFRFAEPAADSIPVWPVEEDGFEAWRSQQPAAAAAWLKAGAFSAKAGNVAKLPDEEGGLAGILLITEEPENPDSLWSYGALPGALPPGVFHIDAELDGRVAERIALGWAYGAYDFDRYKTEKTEQAGEPARLVPPPAADRDRVEALARGVYLTRDLVNIPTADMGPAELAEAAKELADRFDAKCRIVDGRRLEEEFPMIHAVGRASVSAPRLIDLTWGDKNAPKVTLVGKGVCFDSGGLDLKSASNMELMKKDMGGAAHALGLAAMIMAGGLNLRLRVLVPAVENSVAGNAFRPGDVLNSYKGLTVEIGNTDAEGRLILGDALAYGVEEDPDLLIDFATLTGAARVALGPDLPAVMTDDDEFFEDLAHHGRAQADPVWRLPLWQPYAENMASKVADLRNISSDSFAGAITAGLFLKRFAEGARSWTHIDLFAWAPKAKPGRPVGGEAYSLRALEALLRQRYG